MLTSKGPIEAREVVIATNGYTTDLTPTLKRQLVPVASHIIATEELPEDLVQSLIPKNRVVSDTKRVLCYYRQSPDNKRVIFGGRARFTQVTPEVSAPVLHGYMLERWPQLKGAKVTHAWTGNVAFAFDFLPHMGMEQGMHYLMACNGSGVAMMSYLGYQTARKIAGGSNAPVNAFDGQRFPDRAVLQRQSRMVPAPGRRLVPHPRLVGPHDGLIEINDGQPVDGVDESSTPGDIAMGWRNDAQGFGSVAKGLHWLAAASVLAAWLIGIVGDDPFPKAWKGAILFTHISFGLVVLALLFGRLGWRLTGPAPPAIATPFDPWAGEGGTRRPRPALRAAADGAGHRHRAAVRARSAGAAVRPLRDRLALGARPCLRAVGQGGARTAGAPARVPGDASCRGGAGPSSPAEGRHAPPDVAGWRPALPWAQSMR